MNPRYGRPDVHIFLKALPEGYNTMVDERSVYVSKSVPYHQHVRSD